MAENKNNSSEKEALKEKLKRLKRERYNFNATQSVFSEMDAMDYGPSYRERADSFVNELYDRNKIINSEIEKTENQLKDPDE